MRRISQDFYIACYPPEIRTFCLGGTTDSGPESSGLILSSKRKQAPSWNTACRAERSALGMCFGHFLPVVLFEEDGKWQIAWDHLKRRYPLALWHITSEPTVKQLATALPHHRLYAWHEYL